MTLGDKILTDDHTHCMAVSTRIKRTVSAFKCYTCV